MATDSRTHFLYRIRGRVQGVGFRHFVWNEASQRGIAGWVRNRNDGSVEVLVWATESDITDFEQTLARGPRWGHVDALQRSEVEQSETFSSAFEIRPTV